MQKKQEQYRTIGMITFEGRPVEMQTTKKGELRFVVNKKEVTDTKQIDRILAYLKHANE